MIRATGICLQRGRKPLLEHADFVIHPQERLGIVGKNGSGKSSLFALLLGDLDPDAGTLSIPPQWRIAHLKQETLIGQQSARDFVIDGDQHLRQLQARRANTPDDDGQAIAELEQALTDAGHWHAHARAEQLLAGLGFSPSQWDQAIEQFSGGWQVRLALARTLMMPSDLLLLDEPTNHLDLDAMLWLEKWLQHYEGTVVMISHDSEFLNACCQHILHLSQRRLNRYKGNYDAFLLQRAQRLQQQQIAIERQQAQAQRLQAFINRFKAKASKAKQAQSRVKALARMQTLAPLHFEAGVHFSLPNPDHMPDPLIVMEGLRLGYQQNDSEYCVLSDVNLMLRGGARIGVLGVNGAGKSTLVKSIAQELKPLSGILQRSKGLHIGYFAQHQLEMLRMEQTPLQHLQAIADPRYREQELRDYLGRFGFHGDMVQSPIAPFSGGEKARLALALIVWQKPNLLLLDEPTNHLDADTREALATALAEFEGSVLIVSHDRQLLRSTVDAFWIVADGTVQIFDGDLEDYQQWLTQRQQVKSVPDKSGIDRKAQKRLEAQQRQEKANRRRPLAQALTKTETQLQTAQQQLALLDAQMSDPDFYTDAMRGQRQHILQQHGELRQRIDALEEECLQLMQAIEDIDAL